MNKESLPISLGFISFTSATLSNYSTEVDLSTAISYELTKPNKLKINITNYTTEQKTALFEFIKVGSYIKAKLGDLGGRNRMLKIISVSTQVDSTISHSVSYTVIETMSSYSQNVLGIDINGGSITVYKGIPNFTNTLNGLKLLPFKISETLLPNGTVDKQDDILKFMFDTNIAEAITESEVIDIRYIVDTYQGEISAQSKYYLTKLAATHGQAMAFLNAPSMKQFELNTDPSFLDVTNGLIRTDYIASGGNLDLQPSFQYGFASDTYNGIPIESYVHYTFPHLLINDNGKEKIMIPAPYVCNAYIRKFKANSPYTIIAGQSGRITDVDVTGVEYELSDKDRGLLEPLGYNLLVRKRRGGVMLFTDNTGYQRVRSALNNAHVRDTLITLEKSIEQILFNFLFRYNTPILRVRVDGLVKDYLSGVQINGGISSYTTKIDEKNNNQYVLEHNSAVIDISIDFPRGANKFVNTITITRVGGQLSVTQSGFSA